MEKSIKSNIIYNVINTVSGFIFPLIAFPYVSRILMAEGIGQVNFFNSIIGYIVLLTGLGIPIYGIREIARVRDDKKELTRTALEILLLNLILNIIGYIIVFVICFTIPQIKDNSPLFLLLSSTILLTSIGCNWFYSGVEDFKFITLRGLLVRCVSLLLLFTLVDSKDDLLYYGLYYVLSSVGSNFINFLWLKKHIKTNLISFTDINPWRHIQPTFAVFIFSIVTSIYINLDKVMLGFIKGVASVGYYSAATQISHILLIAATSLSAVMLPRSSNLVKNNRLDEFYKLTERTYQFVLLISLPLTAGCIVMSPILIHIFCGNTYEPSIITLQIIAPIIIAIGISNLIGMLILYPLGCIRIVIYSTCIGALINVLLNIILIPKLAQNGAAIATVFAEVGVTLTQFIIAKKYVRFRLFTMRYIIYILSTLVMFASCGIVVKLDISEYVKLILVPSLGVFIYGSLLYITKDRLFLEALKFISSKIKHYG